MNRGLEAGLRESPARKTNRVCLAGRSEAWLVNRSALFDQFSKMHEESTKAGEMV